MDPLWYFWPFKFEFFSELFLYTLSRVSPLGIRQNEKLFKSEIEPHFLPNYYEPAFNTALAFDGMSDTLLEV